MNFLGSGFYDIFSGCASSAPSCRRRPGPLVADYNYLQHTSDYFSSSLRRFLFSLLLNSNSFQLFFPFRSMTNPDRHFLLYSTSLHHLQLLPSSQPFGSNYNLSILSIHDLTHTYISTSTVRTKPEQKAAVGGFLFPHQSVYLSITTPPPFFFFGGEGVF